MKKIIVSIILSIFVIFLFDISWYSFDIYKINKLLAKKNISSRYKWHYTIITKPAGIIDVVDFEFREPINIKSDKAPILIFGCSYAFGHYLNPNQNFGANLAKLTKRSVYNFGMPGASVQQFLVLLENKDFQITPPPEYIIYVYMNDHIRRMYTKFYDSYERQYPIRYKLQNNDLILDKDTYVSLYLYKKLNCFLSKLKAENPKYNKINMSNFSKYINKANLLIKEKFPNSKFIIYVYEEEENYDWSIIENIGVKVVINTDLNNVIAMKMSDGHPSAEAWKYFTPIFIKEAGIK